MRSQEQTGLEIDPRFLGKVALAILLVLGLAVRI